MSGKDQQRGDYDENECEDAPPKRRGTRGWRRGGFAAVLLENAVDTTKREWDSTGRSRKRRRRTQQRYD
jgi:hypothetical protein